MTRTPQVWLIGQAPGPNGASWKPFDGSSGKKLADLAGISREMFLSIFQRRNLLDTWPGKAGKGDAFRIEDGKLAAAYLRIEFHAGDCVLCAGSAVLRCFGFRNVPWCTWTYEQGIAFAKIPHPSGINRLWNDLGMTRDVQHFLQNLVHWRITHGKSPITEA
jgi:uracil-DNA glycosylase